MSSEANELKSLLDAHGLAALMNLQPDMADDLHAVASLQLPQGCIAAGYIRNFVWDILHGYPDRTPLQDVDVLYYDPEHLDEEAEKQIDAKLRKLKPQYNWSAKNQARMHLKNGHQPYASVEDAMSYWPETATAVAAFYGEDGTLQIAAPLGLEDLLALRVKENPKCSNQGVFERRVHSKGWLVQWPRLTVHPQTRSQQDGSGGSI